jgi:PAS domain S-box-containing protein
MENRIMTKEPSRPELAAELEDLRARLAEAEEALRAIRTGEVDAVVVAGERGEQVYSLSGADRVYRQLIETMSEGAVTLSADGVILYGNIRLAEMLGRPLDQVLGSALRNYLPPEDQQALDSVLAQSRTAPSRMEINLKTGEGRLTPVYLSASRLQSEGAEMVFCLVLTDLTEQKSHEQIVAAERLARLILEQAAGAIVVCDEQGRVIRASQAAQRFCDDSPLLRLFSEVFPLRTDASDPFHLAQVLQGETLRNVDVALEWQGQEFDLILNAGPLLSGRQILGCVVTLTDITERKRAEDALLRQTERLRNLHGVDQAILLAIESPEAIAQTALRHLPSLIHCQRSSIGIFDLEKKEVRVFATEINGETIVQMGRDLAEESYGDMEILRQGRIEVVEDMSRVTSPPAVVRILQAEGIQSSINVPLLSERGLIGALNIGWEDPRTITPEETEIAGEVADQIAIAIEHARLLQETKRHAVELEQRVAERTAQLEMSNKELEAFAYSVSHDLRAPLRAVDGFSRIVLEEYSDKLDDEGKRLLNMVRANTQKMDKLIADLLELSRMTQAQIQSSRIDMTAMAQSVYQEVALPEVRERFEFSIAALTDAMGDPTLIRQVWRNLLSNAVKFTSPRDTRRIEVGGYTEKDRNVYFVKDSGVGFDPQYAHKLFGAFQRLHKASEFEGTGIGLAIVLRIVHRHGGEVWAEGKVNEGATVYFTLGNRH